MTSEKHHHKRTSQILSSIIEDTKGDGDITLYSILDLLGHRAFGMAILVFSLPNSLPIPSPPGFSLITGIPIVLMAVQMMMGKDRPWLPARIGNRSFSRKKLTAFLTRAIPYVEKVERLLHPRLHFMHTRMAERFIGLAFLVLSIVLSLPIPFANFLPGFSMSLIALGMVERDGAVMLAGAICGVGLGIGILTAIDVLVETVVKSVTNFF